MREDTTHAAAAVGVSPPRRWLSENKRVKASIVVIGVVLIVTIAALVGTAAATTITISFEEFQDGTDLTTQTEDRGVRFEVQEGADTGAIVTTCGGDNLDCTVAQTGQNAIVTPVGSDSIQTDFGPQREPLVAVFTDPQQAVRLSIQDGPRLQGSQIAILTARDAAGEVVARSRIVFEPRSGWHQIGVSTDTAAIMRVTLTLTAEVDPDVPHNIMVVDDLTYVRNDPPSAAFDVDPAEPIAEEPVVFNAAKASDRDGEIVEYRWDFSGNGEPDAVRQQPSVTATFQEPGTYDVTLEVVDNTGATDRATRQVTVLGPPSAQCRVSDTRIEKGESVFIDASGSEAQRVRFDVDGDGDYDRTVSDIFRVATSYDTSDTYQPVVRAEVRDQTDRTQCPEITVYTTVLGIPTDIAFGGLGGVFGLVTLRKIHREVKNNNPPDAAMQVVPEEPSPGRPVYFDGSGSSDPDRGDQVVGYQWTIDDRAAAGPRVVHTFLQEGDHNVKLRVLDTHGAVDTTTKEITVEATEGELALDEVHPDAPGNDHENLEEEYLVFKNAGDDDLALGDWTIHDTAETTGQVTPGAHTFTFPKEFTLEPDAAVVVHTGTAPEDGPANGDSDNSRHLYWDQPRAIWNNDEDTIVVEDDNGHPVLAVRYTRMDSGAYEIEDLDVEVLDEWFGSVVVSKREDAPLVSVIPGAGLGIAVVMWLVTTAWGGTFLAGPKRFLYSWANITGYFGSSSVAWALVTGTGVLLPSIEPIGPVLVVVGSVGMMLVGGVGVSLHKILSVLLGWVG